MELIEGKIKNFVSTAEMMVRDHTHDSQRIRQEVDEVERKWSRFYTSIHDYRAALDSSTKFFVMMDKVRQTALIHRLHCLSKYLPTYWYHL